MRRARQSVPFWAGDALRQERLLQPEHGFPVLGMHQRQRAQLTALREALEHDLVVDHESALVGHEVLEAVDAAIDALGHLLCRAVRPAGDGDMEAIIGTGLLGPLRPLVEPLGQALG